MTKLSKKCLILLFAVILALAFQAIMLSVATTTALATDLEPLCTATWGGGGDDQAWDVIKVGDYLYVTGNKGTSSNADLFVRKYAVGCDATWQMEWEKTWDNGEKDAGFVIVSDGSYLYVAGITKEAVTGGYATKALLQKRYLSSNPNIDGTIVWTKKWGTEANHYYEGNGLAIYGNYIYLSHWDQVLWPSYSIDAVVRKFDLDGNEQWDPPFTISDSSADGHIYADSSGVYVAGRTKVDPNSWDAYVAKINSNGTQDWFETWGDVNYNQALSLSSDGSYLYLSGLTNTDGSDPNAILLKYEMNGDLADETLQDYYVDFSRGISVDTNYIYMSVYSKDGNNPGSTTLVTYDKSDPVTPADERIWADTGDENLATSIYADNSYLYMVGKTSSTQYRDYDARLIKVAKPDPNP